MADNNLNHDPASSPTWWMQLITVLPDQPVNLAAAGLSISDDGTANGIALESVLANGEAEFYLPTGDFLIKPQDSFGVPIPSTVRKIYGPGTLQYAGADGFACILYVDGTDGVEISINMEANRVSFPSVIPFMILDDAGPTKNVTVRGCKFPQSGLMAILALGTGAMESVVIEDNVIENFVGSAIRAFACGGLTIRRNRCLGDNTNTFHMIRAVGPKAVVVEDNELRNNGSLGFALSVEDAGSGTSVSRNKIIDGQLDGIDFLALALDVPGGWEICDNIIDAETVASQEVGIGLAAYGGRSLLNGTVSGNVIRKRWFMGIAVGVIGANAVCNSIDILSNTILDCNQNARVADDDSGIALLGSNTDVGSTVSEIIVKGNTIRSSDAKTKWGVAEVQEANGTVLHNAILDNVASGPASGSVKLPLGAGSIQANNQLF